jgi:hypothetical protein
MEPTQQFPRCEAGDPTKLGPTARESREFHVKATLGLLVALMLFPINGHSAPPSGYVLTFSDEFDSTFLDTGKWAKCYIWGGGTTCRLNDEADIKTDNGTRVVSTRVGSQ